MAFNIQSLPKVRHAMKTLVPSGSLLTHSDVGAIAESIVVRHRELACLSTERLAFEALKILRTELDLAADDQRRRVIERLRAWLLLDRGDARRLALGFEEAAEQLEASEREAIQRAEEDAVMDGLSYLEFHRLAEVVPSLRRLREGSPLGSDKHGKSFFESLATVLALSGSGADF
jgi:hypothetical protein